ncbi:MAG: DNA repair protein RecN [Gammaproteobacteria bacterium]
MLVSLDIQNYAMISTLSLDFTSGLSVVTGETGAGKSILIEALGLTLGERAEGSVIGNRRADCSVTASYQVTDNPRVQAWLGDQALGDGDLCTLRRVLYRDGRPSRAFINDRPVTLQTLRELGDCLIDLHGQHEHQSLTRRAAQLDLLDAVGNLGDTARLVRECFSAWQEARSELMRCEEQAAENEEIRKTNLERLESLRSLNPQPGEFETLVQSQRRIDHLERIRQGLAVIREALIHPDAPSCESLLRRAERESRSLIPLDPMLEPLATSIEETLTRLEGCAEAIDRYETDQDLDPDAIAHLTQRFDGYQSLAYKYRLRPETLHEAFAALSQIADTLEGGEQGIERIRLEASARESLFLEAAQKLTAGRRLTAQRLTEAVNALLPDFGMAGAALRITLESGAASVHGLETVTFQFASHPDQEAWALGKVASGGELSRIALAIQLSSADAQWIPTLIFDEVDVGIGGRVAELVGQKLRALGTRRQVLCITHLPQVACQGHHHFKVVKVVSDGTPETRVEALPPQAREEELARMLAGSVVTQTARRHAREMLEQAAGELPARKRVE